MQMIKLTLIHDGDPIYLCINDISSFFHNGKNDETTLSTRGKDEILVKETPDEIMAIIGKVERVQVVQK